MALEPKCPNTSSGSGVVALAQGKSRELWEGPGSPGTQGDNAFVPDIEDFHFPWIWGLGQGDW